MGEHPDPVARAAAAIVEVVCCAPVDGRLTVLVRAPVRSGGRASLPWASIGSSPLAVHAGSLVREGTGRGPGWIAQAGVIAEGPAHPSGAGLSVLFVAAVPIGTTPVEGYRWAPITGLPPLAARQAAAVDAAIVALRDRMDVAPVAFRLLPPEFTLSELQGIYELLLGRRLHKASFRRSLLAAALVEATSDWRSEGRGRPARLFRYAPRRRRGVRRPVRFELLS
jgi:8-oxo-dGTP diphosphatase